MTDLKLPGFVRDLMLAETRSRMPTEACGLVTGPPGRADTVWGLDNALSGVAAHTGYRFVSEQYLNILADCERMQHEVFCVWHSHTDGSSAYPSQEDIDMAANPWPMVIVSARDWSVRGFTVHRRAVSEVTLRWM